MSIYDSVRAKGASFEEEAKYFFSHMPPPRAAVDFSAANAWAQKTYSEAYSKRGVFRTLASPNAKTAAGRLARSGLGPKAMGFSALASAGFAVADFVNTQGPSHLKAQAAAKTFASGIASDIGAVVGGAIGGFLIGGPLGLAGGTVAGFLGLSLGVESVMQTGFNIVNAGASRVAQKRRLEWGTDAAQFQTERAYTMRQQSLAAMNRGEASARSLMGREAMYVHR